MKRKEKEMEEIEEGGVINEKTDGEMVDDRKWKKEESN